MFKNKYAISLTAALILTVSTGYAGNGNGNGNGNNGNKGGNGGSAIISYSVDPHSCAVTVSSTKDISNIVLKDAHGNIKKKWDNLSGKNFSNWGAYTAFLADGTLHVKSGNNGNRGLGPDIGAQFRHNLLSCLERCDLGDQDDIVTAIVTPFFGDFHEYTFGSCSAGTNFIITTNSPTLGPVVLTADTTTWLTYLEDDLGSTTPQACFDLLCAQPEQ